MDVDEFFATVQRGTRFRMHTGSFFNGAVYTATGPAQPVSRDDLRVPFAYPDGHLQRTGGLRRSLTTNETTFQIVEG